MKRKSSAKHPVQKKFRKAAKVHKGGKKFAKHFAKPRRRTEKIFRAPTSGVSHSTASLKHKGVKIPKSLKLLMPLCRYRDFFTNSTINSLVSGVGFQSGVQAVANVFSTFGGIDIQTLANTALTRYNSSASVGALISSQNYKQQSFKLLLEHVSTTTGFTNAASDCLVLDIYDCLAKRDFTSTSSADPLTDWNQGVVDTSLGGITAVPGASSDALAYNIPFTTPEESKLFNLKWKIIKRTKVELGLGRAHEHVFSYSPNKIVDTELYFSNSVSNSSNYQTTEGLTHFQFVVARSIFLDTTNSATSVSGTTSLGPVKVVCGGSRLFSFKMLGDQPTNMQYNSNMYSVNVGNTQVVYNEGSGSQNTVSYQ